MKYIHTYESYITKYDDYIEINLTDFYDEEKFNKLDVLRSLVVGKVVTFSGTPSEFSKDRVIKGLISNVHVSGVWSFTFDIISNGKEHTYRVMDRIPIKIHTVESEANKYNL